ncbi:unnamed protein product [Pedinophyceae sp. YPF-701]|nr:unnamed protein product [Pedinophyceae sp. YPF-701]
MCTRATRAWTDGGFAASGGARCPPAGGHAREVSGSASADRNGSARRRDRGTSRPSDDLLGLSQAELAASTARDLLELARDEFSKRPPESEEVDRVLQEIGVRDPVTMLESLYRGDPTFLRLGRGNGALLVDTFMRLRPDALRTSEPESDGDGDDDPRADAQAAASADEAAGAAGVDEQDEEDLPGSRLDEFGRASAVGTRKTAAARACIYPVGTGKITVNGKPLDVYLPSMRARRRLIWPLYVTGQLCAVDVELTAQGGGRIGQAEAGRLALARALKDLDPRHGPVLRAWRLLTLDRRQVERKKPTRKSARTAKQWSKR